MSLIAQSRRRRDASRLRAPTRAHKPAFRPLSADAGRRCPRGQSRTGQRFGWTVQKLSPSIEAIGYKRSHRRLPRAFSSHLQPSASVGQGHLEHRPISRLRPSTVLPDLLTPVETPGSVSSLQALPPSRPCRCRRRDASVHGMMTGASSGPRGAMLGAPAPSSGRCIEIYAPIRPAHVQRLERSRR
jgi:hypothetical protein